MSYIRNKSELKSLISLVIKYAVLITIVIFVFTPLYIIVSTSLKTPKEVSSLTPLALPQGIYLGNFIKTFKEANMLNAFKNSLIIAGVSVFFNVIIGAMVTYIISRFEFGLKKYVLGIFYAAMMIPFYTTEIARFKLINSLGLFNTLWAPIIIYVGADMMQIFIFKQYMDKIPVSLDESAMIEGASFFRIFTSVIFPLTIPAAATLAIIKFVEITNDMYIPYLYIPSIKYKTMTTALLEYAGQFTINWANISACMIWIIIPTLLLYIAFQKQILSGITAGSVKE
ncbi:MAG: carbohydrate ABC transporter permease [Clostridia bacterium]|nr:carbohydrate ABC transporter permease [Clostridia bacterium]